MADSKDLPHRKPADTSASVGGSSTGASPAVLAVADVEGIVRVLNVAISNELTPAARRRIIVEGLAKLIEADTWIWIRYRVEDVSQPRPVPFDIIDGGYADEVERGQYITGSSDEVLSSVFNPQMITDQPKTIVMNQILPAKPENTMLIDRWRRLTGMGDFIVSTYPLAPQLWSGLAFNRRVGSPAFSERDWTIVRVLVGQLDFLHREGTDVPANSDTLLTLSPRERQVLIFLLGGDQVKSVADKMALSLHTVKDHVKAIYRRLNVSTRPELMKLFMSGDKRSETPPTTPGPADVDKTSPPLERGD